VKIAYLAPEIPALSATFVYNEILTLEAMGTEVVPFSVHKPSGDINEPAVQKLQQKVHCLYQQPLLSVFKDVVLLFLTHPQNSFKALMLLFSDMWTLGLLSRTSWGLGYRFLYSANLARRIIKNECSHIHVHFAHVPTDIAMYAAVFSNISFSVTAHANDLFERGWLLSEKVSRSAFFATISEFNQRFLVGLGVDKEKVKIIRCGVDADKFSMRLGFVRNTRVKLGLVGRLVEKKGVDTLINAVSLLKQQGILFELYIAGSGPLEDELKLHVQQLGLDSDEVVFLGVIAHKDVAEFITSLDAFVLPCKQDRQGDMDGVPVVLMEAMLSGVPVISTELSGIPELVINKETGLLVKPNDERGLADAIIAIINQDELRVNMINNAISKVSSEFSLVGNVKKLYELLKGVKM